MAKRRFGIEIECGVYYPQELLDRLPKSQTRIVRKRKKLQCGCCYTTQESIHLKGIGPIPVKMENSVRPGFELNTPILNDVDKIKNLSHLFDVLRELKVKPTEKCGIHVHVESNYANRLRTNFQHENRYSWDFGSKSLQAYTTLIDLWKKTKIPLTMKPRPERSRYCSGTPGFGKDRAINISNKGTLEFRIFDSRLNSRYILSAVKFCLKFTDKFEEACHEIWN